jgi:hypothetical protein
LNPAVELIYDPDCPNVGAARSAVVQAFVRAGLPPAWVEWDRGSPESPDYARAFGSPTVLVDGRDVADAEPGSEAKRCRLYEDGGRLQPVPPVERIARALTAATGGRASLERTTGARWQGLMPAVSGIGAGLLPTCPACWPAYAGVLGAAGFGFLLEESVLLPAAAVLLSLTLFLLAVGARRRRGYGPLWLGTAAVALVAGAKFILGSDALLYGGLGLLVAASAWNAWPRAENGDGVCPACPPQEHETETTAVT